MAKKDEIEPPVVEKETKVKEPPPPPPSPKALRMAKLMASKSMEAIEKKFGEGAMIRASDSKHQTVHRVSTGSLMLDWATGGGFPVGHVTTLFGKEQSSKTTTYLRAIAEAQQMCGNCWTYLNEKGKCECGKYSDVVVAYLDAEGTFDFGWAKRMGVDLDRLIFNQPSTGEEALDQLDALARSTYCDIIVIDSIAFLAPEREVDASMSNNEPGIQARMMGKGFRKLTSALNEMRKKTGKRPTPWFTNQTRLKVGVVFGSPVTVSGGSAARFGASLEVSTSRGKAQIDEKTSRPVSVEMNFKVEKNKTDVPFIEGDYRMMLCNTEMKKLGSIYDEDVMVEKAEVLGIVSKKEGSWHCLGQEFSAKSKIERQAMLDPRFRRQLRQVVVAAMLASAAA